MQTADRVISITLSEQEWQAFLAAEPQPVAWLLARIRDVVDVRASSSTAAGAGCRTSATS